MIQNPLLAQAYRSAALALALVVAGCGGQQPGTPDGRVAPADSKPASDAALVATTDAAPDASTMSVIDGSIRSADAAVDAGATSSTDATINLPSDARATSVDAAPVDAAPQPSDAAQPDAAVDALVAVAPNWSQLSPPQSPSLRTEQQTDYDAVRDRIVLFGGIDSNGTKFDDTWEWDGTTWQSMSPMHKPPARRSGKMAYDPVRGVSVMFGGESQTGYSDDTWTWDGTDWTEQNPVQVPPSRSVFGMDYDATLDRVVMFGGFGQGCFNKFNSPYCGDTWQWDGSQWLEVTPSDPSSSPTARYGFAYVYDSQLGQIVMFGGAATSGGGNDTWTWDGAAWTQLSTATSPDSRYYTSMTYDSSTNRMVLWAGVLAASNSYASDMWQWDGANWSLLTPINTPQAQANESLVYDPVRDEIVSFGGDGLFGNENNQTWRYGN